MTRPWRAVALALLSIVCARVEAFASASAQGASADKPDAEQSASVSESADSFRFQVAGGLGWAGSYPIGDSPADLILNASGQAPPPFTLFRTSSSFESAPGVEARFGVAITPRLTIEIGGAFSQPTLRVEISDDTETSDTSFDGETISQYLVDVSLVWEIPVPSTARVRPFAIGGGGYLRQLHEDRSLVETGQLYHFGGGARVFFHGAASGHPFGIRCDVQAAFRRDGIEFEDKRRVMPTASILVFFGF